MVPWMAFGLIITSNTVLGVLGMVGMREDFTGSVICLDRNPWLDKRRAISLKSIFDQEAEYP